MSPLTNWTLLIDLGHFSLKRNVLWEDNIAVSSCGGKQSRPVMENMTGTMFPVSASVLTSDILRLPSGLSQELCFLDTIFGDALRFPLKMWCCSANPPTVLQRKAEVLGMERNKPRWFLKVKPLKFYGTAAHGASEGKARTRLSCIRQLSYRPPFRINLPYAVDWTHIHMVRTIVSRWQHVFSNGENNCWQHGPFTLYWPHLNKPPTQHTQLSPPVCRIPFKPFWVKALSLPSFNKMPVHSSWGFHVSPNTERRAQKKSPPERNPICVLIHSAGLDMSKQLAFTALATIFTLHWQTVLSPNAHTHTFWINVLDGRPKTISRIERDEH